MRGGGFLGRACQGGITKGERATPLSYVQFMKNLILIPHLQTFNTSGATISVFLFRHAYHALTIFAS